MVSIRRSLFIVIFFFFASAIFALGKKEEVVDAPVRNGEWVLCVTDFDVSALSPSRQIIGEVMARSLVGSLNRVDRRIRVSPEYAWYEGRAWSEDRSAAAKALAAKRGERDMLLFKGDPEWRYRRNLEAIDAEIKKLEEALAQAEAQQPPIAGEPVFRFTEENAGGVFPVPPGEGGEYRFCKTQQADAFLAGSVSEYHSRIYISLRLYTMYTGSYIYEDSIIFSSDDTNAAVNEISERLVAAVSGVRPAEIAIHAEPADALVLIGNSFAGRGDIARREYPPGTVTVEIFAENHEPVSVETELKSGELTDVQATLRPLDLNAVNISVPGKTGVLIYRGSQYVGEAPLTLELPVNQLEYIYAETLNGETAPVVFQVYEGFNNLSLRTKAQSAGENRVDKARRRYYWSWGGTWVAAIAAWVINGITNAEIAAYNYGGNYTPEGYERAQNMQRLNIAGGALVGAAAALEIFQMVRYIVIAGEGAAPLVD